MLKGLSIIFCRLATPKDFDMVDLFFFLFFFFLRGGGGGGGKGGVVVVCLFLFVVWFCFVLLFVSESPSTCQVSRLF